MKNNIKTKVNCVKNNKNKKKCPKITIKNNCKKVKISNKKNKVLS